MTALRLTLPCPPPALSGRKLCESQIAQCGKSAHLAIFQFGNDHETGLWFARQIGNIIESHHLSKSDIRQAAITAYSQYVIATNLKPAMDNALFVAEVLRAATVAPWVPR